MSNNKYSIFNDALNATKKGAASEGKSNILKDIENTPKTAPKNLYKEYHNDYSRHRDLCIEEYKDSANINNNSPRPTGS